MFVIIEKKISWTAIPRCGSNSSSSRLGVFADRRGRTASFALFGLQERGALFVGPGEEVYEGMIVGENGRSEDLDVNAVKEKHLTNMRSSTSDVLVRLVPPRRLSLDQAMEFVREDECVEVTPAAVRLRKVELDATRRHKLARNRARDRVAAPLAGECADFLKPCPPSRAWCSTRGRCRQ